MADAAASFFANKKKKKKAFKFNANKIDAATIEKKIHVDAPALSTDNEQVPVSAAAQASSTPVESKEAAEQWDDAAMAATMTQKKAVASSGNAAELLDMKALDLKRSEQGDIQEKLRVEDNKAKLAAAREGMEKEALRLKEQKEKKETESSTGAKPRFGAAAAGFAASGSKWVPPHMRGGGGPSLSSRLGMGGATSQKLDTEDEDLFPDLAAADAILEKQRSVGPAYKAPKKTPVGGGATWGSKTKSKKADAGPSKAAAIAEREAPTEAAPPSTKPAAPTETEATTAAAPVAAAPAKAPLKPKKKKKKDLSTFKPSS